MYNADRPAKECCSAARKDRCGARKGAVAVFLEESGNEPEVHGEESGREYL